MKPTPYMLTGDGVRRRVAYLAGSGLFQSALPFVTLPLTTVFLGPADFALYGLTATISGLIAAFAQLGSVFVLGQKFPTRIGQSRRELVSTVFAQVLLTSAVLSVGLIAIWPSLRTHWSAVANVNLAMISMVAGATIGASIYSLTSVLAVLGYRVSQFVALTMTKAVVGAATTLLALYCFNGGVESLFIGFFAAESLGLLGSTLLLSPLLTPQLDAAVSGQCLRLGGWSSLAQLTMQARQLFERALLSTATGLHSLGIFIHAQQYQNYTMVAVRPLQQAIVPVLLAEAREEMDVFDRTARTTRLIYLFVTLSGVTLALIGSDLIRLMTNNKFNEAAPYAALLVGALLVQFSGRPQFGRLFSLAEGRYLSLTNIASVVGATIALIVLVPTMGIGAAVASIYIQSLLFRFALGLHAKSYRLPFQDGAAIAGVLVIAAATCLVHEFSIPFWARCGILLIVAGALGVMSQHVVVDAWRQISAVLKPLLPGHRTLA